MLSTFASYQLASRDLTATIQRVADQPQQAREIEYYRENIESIKTIDQFIEDDRIFNFAMQATGLGEMSYAKAFMKKVLTEGIRNDGAFANTLTDTRYREFAETFNFELFGEATTILESVRDGVVDMYLRQTLEEQEGDQNQGVRLALYFERKAPEINSYLEILADPAIAEVARTALGLPGEIAGTDIDKQAAILQDRLDIEDFKDPEKLANFLQRFTSLWDLNNPQTTTSSVPGLLIGTGTPFGISESTLLSISQLKRS